jgi:hypothetical protein
VSYQGGGIGGPFKEGCVGSPAEGIAGGADSAGEANGCESILGCLIDGRVASTASGCRVGKGEAVDNGELGGNVESGLGGDVDGDDGHRGTAG